MHRNRIYQNLEIHFLLYTFCVFPSCTFIISLILSVSQTPIVIKS